jgi:uncharacterized protein YjdB
LTVDGLRLSVLLLAAAVTGCVKGSTEPGLDVNGPPIATVTITPANASVKSGSTQQFSVSFQPVPSNSNVVWSVTDTVTASIDQTGKLTAKSPGKTNVTATLVINVNTKGVAPVTVTQP